MKKKVKFLLTGIGIAAIGLIAYKLLKNDSEATKTPSEEDILEKDLSGTASSSAQEFVERRKKKAAELQEARKAAQMQSEQSEVLDSDSDDTDTEEMDNQTTVTETELAVDSQSEETPVVEDPTKSE